MSSGCVLGNIAPETEPWQLAKYLMEGLDEADIGLEMEIDISILQNTDYACASVTLPADKRSHVLSFHRRWVEVTLWKIIQS